MKKLKVNPILCDGFGYCMDLFPEGIERDDWGYPILADEPVPPRVMDHAFAAIKKCPRNALFLADEEKA